MTEQVECDEVIFHVPNFLDYIGENIYSISSSDPDNYKVSNRGGRQRLTNGIWEIIIDNVFNHTEVQEKVEAQAGFGITHVGMLHRLDEGVFKASEGFPADIQAA